ncbi:MAG: single-stranded DNA-binding protein [Bifidobacteriaceae bacterium]|jgi:single-stranded DNA-binding protein|nr:single-stranded DNA-binding protein [Bifidobacteriaceae bacterium]
MPLKTQTSVSGFVASTPMLTRTDNGDARLFIKLGQEHYTRNPDGSFTQGETTFHDLVMFRRSAERAAAQIEKMDWVVAEGYVHPYTVTDADGQMSEREEFIARRIGHDSARSNYTVHRKPRPLAGEAGAIDGPSQASGQAVAARGPNSQAGTATIQPATRPAPAAIGM